jgi:hypothetical protein
MQLRRVLRRILALIRLSRRRPYRLDPLLHIYLSPF